MRTFEALSAVVLIVLFSGSVALGLFVRSHVPEQHRSKESIEMIQLVMSLLVTFAAIVLGLLTTSVKTVYDTAEHDRIQYAAELTQLDRCLRNYGPGSEAVRSQLRSYTAAVIASTWSSEPPPTGVPYPNTAQMPAVGATPVLADMMNAIGVEIRRLDPPDPFHQKLAQDCYDVYLDVLKGRWSVIEDVYSSMSTPFFCAVVFWLVIVFAGFGLRAPANLSVLMVIGLCVISVTSALLIIVDMNLPYAGYLRIPSAPMRDALAHMLRP